MHGQRTFYNKDGIKLYEGEFKAGILHGQGTLYNEDGTIFYEGEFRDGEPVY